ncbi:MAG: hypothetical protein Q4F97_04980 [Bacteroidales bacterium]|nr:hypothetical protein [Bacteroidales bacterium]
MRDLINIAFPIAKYNLKIIFSGKFIWFLLSALLFYLLFMTISVYTGTNINEELVYNLLIYPALLLIFYPTTFGIQNDSDSRILEILFGIPNYRYKVWLVRLLMIYIAAYVIIFLFAVLSFFLLYRSNPIDVASQIMFPLLFIGNLTFWISTLTKSGSGSAIIIIILIAGASILGTIDPIKNSSWDIFINPYKVNDNMNPIIWESIIFKNRMYLIIGAIVTLLLGTLNLQKREKFV